MNCRDCRRYDPEAKVCLDGKINPHRYETALEASKLYGLRSICPFSDHRERLIWARSGPLTRGAKRPNR